MYDVWLQVTIRSIEPPAVRSVRERFGPLQAAALLRLKPNRSGSLTARLNGLGEERHEGEKALPIESRYAEAEALAS
jgi:hypothetical protein